MAEASAENGCILYAKQRSSVVRLYVFTCIYVNCRIMQLTRRATRTDESNLDCKLSSYKCSAFGFISVCVCESGYWLLSCALFDSPERLFRELWNVYSKINAPDDEFVETLDIFLSRREKRQEIKIEN